jgi:PPOX class probable F420-dependent enzyme
VSGRREVGQSERGGGKLRPYAGSSRLISAAGALAQMPAWALDLLRRARVARLATVDAAGAPHAVPVCFVLDDDGVLWTPIDGKPKRTRALQRVENLRHDPRATLIVDHYEEDWRALRWVAVHAHGELVTGHAAGSALDLLRAKYPQYHEVEIGPEAIRLVPQRIAAWAASEEPR